MGCASPSSNATNKMFTLLEREREIADAPNAQKLVF
jgi:hypothetical protein